MSEESRKKISQAATGHGVSEETRKLISERTREAMSLMEDVSWKIRQRAAMLDPLVRQKISENTKAIMQTPEMKAKIEAGRPENWREQISAKLMGHVVSDETRRLNSEHVKEAMARPDVKQKRARTFQDPEYRMKISERMKGRKVSDETRQKNSNAAKEAWKKIKEKQVNECVDIP